MKMKEHAASKLVQGGSLTGTATGPSEVAKSWDDRGGSTGLITREQKPLNLEFPFSTLHSSITPTEQFFVRTHFKIPHLSRDEWRLTCGGDVERELTFNYEELTSLPSQTVAATIECAGNGRVFLTPKAEGVQWELGAVGTASWTGVPLSVILDRAGVKDGAVDVILRGADKGELVEAPKTPGEIHFARSLPLEVANRPEVLLAYRMNGEELAPEHGFPVRVVVPGWYGMASVKWLNHIEVSDEPFQGYWQTAEYSRWSRHAGDPTSTPLGEMHVKSQIARPMRGERIARTIPYRVCGAAWSGGTGIANVEVTADGGQSWQEATLLGDATPFAWRLWEFQWRPPATPGTYVLMSRATDCQGRQQPSIYNVDNKAYLINHTLRIEVEVR
jgi:DMSO/TMAO reductase YedYZ molybdopterin-dependent catalytic subunit